MQLHQQFVTTQAWHHEIGNNQTQFAPLRAQLGVNLQCFFTAFGEFDFQQRTEIVLHHAAQRVEHS
jgi:hypothetical protein